MKTSNDILSPDEQEQLGEAASRHQYLTFIVAKDRYAIDILSIREIIQYQILTPVPMMPKFIAGVLNLRGNVVPVVDLALRLGKKSTPITKRSSIIITGVEDADQSLEIGLIVDGVNDVLEFTQIDPPPAFGSSIRTDFIRGMAPVNDKFIMILNLEKVLSIDELAQADPTLFEQVMKTGETRISA